MVSLVYIGSLLTFVGAVWLIVLSFQNGKTTGEKLLWALVNFICQPIGGIVFYFMKRVGLLPLLLVIIGFILTGVGYPSFVSQMMQNMPK